MSASFSSNSYTPDELLLPDFDVMSQQITLVTGQNLTRGAVLGKITASGKYTLSAAAAGDGSQTPDCVLAEDCDASGGDKVTVAYFVAGVNANGLTLGAGHSVASILEGLRGKDIHIVSAQTTY